MSSANIKKIIPCKKDQLIEMVLDIEKYPEFVPWCLEGKVYEKNESNDLIVFKGDLKVGKSLLNETFTISQFSSAIIFSTISDAIKDFFFFDNFSTSLFL